VNALEFRTSVDFIDEGSLLRKGARGEVGACGAPFVALCRTLVNGTLPGVDPPNARIDAHFFLIHIGGEKTPVPRSLVKNLISRELRRYCSSDGASAHGIWYYESSPFASATDPGANAACFDRLAASGVSFASVGIIKEQQTRAIGLP
jgi:hypothetical protein